MRAQLCVVPREKNEKGHSCERPLVLASFLAASPRTNDKLSSRGHIGGTLIRSMELDWKTC
jgi:hypothetical protein